MAYVGETFVDGPTGGTPINAAALNNIEAELVAIDPLARNAAQTNTGNTFTGGNQIVKIGASSSANVFQILDDSNRLRMSFARITGAATQMQIYGETSEPAIIGLIAPNGTDYADWTFDGSNADLDVSVGTLNLRPLAASSGSVNVWGLNGQVTLKIGNQGFTQALSMYHDGTNGHIGATTGYIGFASDKFQILSTGAVNYTGPTSTTASTGSNGAPPAAVGGYFAFQVGGTTVHVPYYL